MKIGGVLYLIVICIISIQLTSFIINFRTANGKLLIKLQITLVLSNSTTTDWKCFLPIFLMMIMKNIFIPIKLQARVPMGLDSSDDNLSLQTPATSEAS